jgi:hypothetical protein
MCPRQPRYRRLMVRTLLVLTLLVCLATSSARADDDPKIMVAMFGVNYDLPGNATERAFYYFRGSHGPSNSAYVQLDLQFWRLFWSGPHLDEGQQQRFAVLRFGWLPVLASRFAFGFGGIYEGDTIGVPKSWMLSHDHDYFNALGLEATAVMDISPFQAVGHAGFELGANHLRRPVFDLELLVTPIPALPILAFNVAVMHSSFDFRREQTDPTIPQLRDNVSGTDIMFGIGFVPLSKHSRH